LRINRFTPRITELFNIAPGDEGRPITDFTHRLDYDDLAADARKVLRDLSSSERELHSQDGNWFLTRLRPYRTVDDKIDGVVVTFVDIRERRRAEDTLREAESRMRVVVGELQHRTRNLIGVVMAMLDRTAGSDQTLDEFRANFRERLSALARVQGLLSRATPGEGVAFEELLASELSGQSVQNNRAVTLDGPKGLAVSSIAVQAFAMALHELTTNAIKHGALGQTNGRLNVRWRELSENGSTWIIVDWKESGVDTSQSAKRKGGGNGRRLIEDALPYQFGARTTFVIEPDGVRCQIALPVSDSLQEETK